MNDDPDQPVLLPYTKVRKKAKHSDMQMSTLPVGHAISLPMPTLRWDTPAFAVFSGPALHQPGSFPHYGVPDRWWALNAHSARLLAYNLTAVTDSIEFAEPNKPGNLPHRSFNRRDW